MVAAAAANHCEVVRVEGVVPEEVSFVGRKGQQFVALCRGEQLAARHVSSLENLPLREADPTNVRSYKKVAFTFSKTILDSFFSFLHL
jgi:hypothetical protein